MSAQSIHSFASTTLRIVPNTSGSVFVRGEPQWLQNQYETARFSNCPYATDLRSEKLIPPWKKTVVISDVDQTLFPSKEFFSFLSSLQIGAVVKDHAWNERVKMVEVGMLNTLEHLCTLGCVVLLSAGMDEWLSLLLKVLPNVDQFLQDHAIPVISSGYEGERSKVPATAWILTTWRLFEPVVSREYLSDLHWAVSLGDNIREHRGLQHATLSAGLEADVCVVNLWIQEQARAQGLVDSWNGKCRWEIGELDGRRDVAYWSESIFGNGKTLIHSGLFECAIAHLGTKTREALSQVWVDLTDFDHEFSETSDSEEEDAGNLSKNPHPETAHAAVSSMTSSAPFFSASHLLTLNPNPDPDSRVE